MVGLLMETADVSGLGDDDVFHGVEHLGACGVGGKVERLAQRVELEDVVGLYMRRILPVWRTSSIRISASDTGG